MLEKNRTKAQNSRREEPKTAEKTEVAIRKLHAIKNELSQLKLQCQELRLLLEGKYYVLPQSRHEIAGLNTRTEQEVKANDPFGTKTIDNHIMFFPTPTHPGRPDAKQHQKPTSNLTIRHIQFSTLATLSLTASGLAILAFIGWLTWYDMTTWSKDVITIFFGPRTGELLSLGIGMKVIHYFAAGTVLLLSGLINLVRKRRRQTTPRQEHARLRFDALSFQ